MNVGLAGCSDVVTLPVPDAGADPLVACKALQTAQVTHFARCGGVSIAVATYVSRPSEVYCERVDTAVALGRITFDATKIASCEAALARQDCADDSDPADCGAVFVGNVAAGASCSADVECTGTNVCDTSQACPGTCGPGLSVGGNCRLAACRPDLVCTATDGGAGCATPIAQGGLCDPKADACGAGLYCSAPTMVCAPQTPSGPCTGSAECQGRNFCTGTPTAPGQCEAQKGENEPCTAGRSECRYGLDCSGGVCAEWPSLGETCGANVGSELAYCQTGYCKQGAGTPKGTGICTPLGVLFGPCDGNAGVFGEDSCVDPGFCSDGTCAAVVGCY